MTVKDKVAYVDVSFRLPSTATPDQVARWHEVLAQHARPFSRFAFLVNEMEPWNAVICVLDGWLALSKSLDSGQVQIVDFALHNDIVEPTSGDGQTAIYSVQALTDGMAAVIPLPVWSELLHDLPELANLTRAVEAATRSRRAERTLRLGKGTAEMRVAHALVEFCIRLGDRCGSLYHVPLTQQALGDFLGLSSVHVCRTTRRMARDGILQLTDHMDIRVLEPARLMQIAGLDPELFRREITPDLG
ncbi:Crp/Fnr family transcriptional regulator [Tropicibacter oceani]|uniref:Crp/Fnr family transcriptional regulator n=1 Tax=Tropicibacter oceani TaxID=3058420 RepID=A0ABY8QM51_9RHOB|nr:Crp/Fnr family transcriptional regulator [Tropicibacter oceani]WGW05692.1 Crp/Fnr family transcriptional regulator [Tropicibacter oceani]